MTVLRRAGSRPAPGRGSIARTARMADPAERAVSGTKRDLRIHSGAIRQKVQNSNQESGGDHREDLTTFKNNSQCCLEISFLLFIFIHIKNNYPPCRSRPSARTGPAACLRKQTVREAGPGRTAKLALAKRPRITQRSMDASSRKVWGPGFRPCRNPRCGHAPIAQVDRATAF